MHRQLLTCTGLLALTWAEPLPAQLHAPLKPRCSNHSETPYPFTTFPIGTGVTPSPIGPTGTQSYTPTLNSSSVVGPTGFSSSAAPVLPTYPYGPLSSGLSSAPLSTGASSSYAVSPVPPLSNSSASTGGPAYPTYGYTFSFPPFIPSTTSGPTIASTGSPPLPTGNYSGSATGPLSSGESPTATYGNATTVGPVETSKPGSVYPYSFTFPNGTSPASTTYVTTSETMSVTAASSSISNSPITANTTSSLPHGPGPYSFSSFPANPTNVSPTVSPIVTGTAVPTYSYNGSSSSVVTANTTAGPTGSSSGLSYGLSTFSTVVSPVGTSSDTTCTEPTTAATSIGTSSEYNYPTPTIANSTTGSPTGASSGFTTAPLTALSASSVAVYSYTPVSGGYPWYEDGSGYQYDDASEDFGFGIDGEDDGDFE
ncbi:MAG: hypothetical protein Q9191_002277 [Dirinaria sp. TL-2023a]